MTEKKQQQKKYVKRSRSHYQDESRQSRSQEVSFSHAVELSLAQKIEKSTHENITCTQNPASIDMQMRRAYDRWRKHFYTFNMETTPAYDVVGLLAALCLLGEEQPMNQMEEVDGKTQYHSSESLSSRFFSVGNVGSDHDVEQEGATVFKLRDQYRSHETLGNIFADPSCTHVFGSCQSNAATDETKTAVKKLGIITDFGEECDDEVTCLLADRLHKAGVLHVRFLFTTKAERFECQRSQFNSWGGDDTNVFSLHDPNHVQSFVDFLAPTTEDHSEPHVLTPFVLLQIGPVHDTYSKALFTEAQISPNTGRRDNPAAQSTLMRHPRFGVPYHYVVVGTFNGTEAFNVKGDARSCALHLLQGAQRRVVVDPMGGRAAFKFCYESLRRCFSSNSSTRTPRGVNRDEAVSQPNASNISDCRITETVNDDDMAQYDYDTISEHVCRIGWRNSVGRASMVPARYVAHLVSCPVPGTSFQGGSNYLAVKALYEAELKRLNQNGHLHVDSQSGEGSNTEHDTGRNDLCPLRNHPRAYKVASRYVHQLQHRVAPPNMDHMRLRVSLSVQESDIPGSVSSPAHNHCNTNAADPAVTLASITDGYVFILNCLFSLFGVPIEYFESGQAECWRTE